MSMPDYTAQLDQIVKALHRPGVSPWVLASFSVFLGVIGGAIGRAIEQPIHDIFRRHRMRRVLYVDMAENLMLLIDTFGDNWKDTEQEWTTLRHYLSTDTDKYIAANQEVFTQLQERPHFTIIFEQFKLVIQEQDKRAVVERMFQIFDTFKQSLEGDGFKRRYLRMALGKWRANNLIESANDVIEQHPAMLRASV
jgi:hypothetical protein